MFSKNLLLATISACVIGGSASAYAQWPLGIGQPKVLFTAAGALRIEVPISSALSGALLSKGLRLSTPDAYRLRGLEFPRVLQGADVTVELRGTNEIFLVIKTKIPATDAFLDLMLEWVEPTVTESRVYSLVLNKPNGPNASRNMASLPDKSNGSPVNPNLSNRGPVPIQNIESTITTPTLSKDGQFNDVVSELVLTEIGSSNLQDGVWDAKDSKLAKKIQVSFKNASGKFQLGDSVELFLNGFSFDPPKRLAVDSKIVSKSSIEFQLMAQDFGNDGEKKITAKIQSSSGVTKLTSLELRFTLDTVDVVELVELGVLVEEPYASQERTESVTTGSINAEEREGTRLKASEEANVSMSVQLGDKSASIDRKVDILAADTSNNDLANADGFMTQSPVAEVPVAEVPVAEVSVAEVSVAEVPVAEVPVAEVPVAEVPVVHPILNSGKGAAAVRNPRNLDISINDILDKKIVRIEWPRKLIKVFVGDKVEVLVNNNKLSNSVFKILTSEDVKVGYVDVELNNKSFDFNLGYIMSAALFDQAGNLVVKSEFFDSGLDNSKTNISIPAERSSVESRENHKSPQLVSENKITPVAKSVSPEVVAAGKIKEVDTVSQNNAGLKKSQTTKSEQIDSQPDSVSITATPPSDVSGVTINPKPTATVGAIFQDKWINAHQATQTQTFRVDLANINLKDMQGGKVELMLDGYSFNRPKIKTIDASSAAKNKYIDFEVMPSELGMNGIKKIYAKLIDQAGNVGPSTLVAEFELDTSPPLAPEIQELDTANLLDGYLNAVEAESPNSFRVFLPKSGMGVSVGENAELVLSGVGASMLKRQVIRENDIKKGYLDISISSKDWGQDGAKSLSARLIDKAGNVGKSSSAISFRKATQKPKPPVLKETQTTLASRPYLNIRNSAQTNKFRVELMDIQANVGDKVEFVIHHLGYQKTKQQLLDAIDVKNKFVEFGVEPSEWELDGEKRLSARLIDQAGNRGIESNALRFYVDRRSPSAIRVDQLNANSLSDGWLNAAEAQQGLQIRVSTEDITSVLEQGSQIQLLVSDVLGPTKLLKTSELRAESNQYVDFEVTKNNLGADGNKTISAQVIDAAGNVTQVQKPLSFMLDTKLPQPVQIQQVGSNELVDGWINAEEINTPKYLRALLPKNGEVNAGAKIEFQINNQPLMSKEIELADISKGYAEVILSSSDIGSDGRKSISARLINRAGNIGAWGNPITFDVDTKVSVVPSRPEIVGLSIANGFINAEQASLIKGIKIPLNSGSALASTAERPEQGDRVELLLNGMSFTISKLKVISDSDLKASFIEIPVTSSELGIDGLKNITARIIDKAGNIGLPSVANSFALVCKAPLVPMIVEYGSQNLSDGWLSALEVSKSLVVRVQMPSTSTAITDGDMIELLLNDQVFTLPKKAGLTSNELDKGFVDFNITKKDLGGDGPKKLTARIIDRAGNLGQSSQPINFILDTFAPLAPKIQEKNTEFATDGYINQKEIQKGLVVNVFLPQKLDVSLRAGDRVELFINKLPFANPKVRMIDEQEIRAGRLEFLINQADLGDDGLKSITAQIRSKSGNTGEMSAAFAFKLDTQLPVHVNLAEANSAYLVDGWLNYIESLKPLNIRVQWSQKVLGNNIEQGDSIELLINGSSFSPPSTKTVLVTDVSKGYLDFAVQSKQLGSDGLKRLSAIVTDKAGNTGHQAAALQFNLATVVPEKPVIKEWGSNDLADGWLNLSEAKVAKTFRVFLPESIGDNANYVLLQLNKNSFMPQKIRSINSAELNSRYVDFVVNFNDWGQDGLKSLSAVIVDRSGNYGLNSEPIDFTLKTYLPPAVPISVR